MQLLILCAIHYVADAAHAEGAAVGLWEYQCISKPSIKRLSQGHTVIAYMDRSLQIKGHFNLGPAML